MRPLSLQLMGLGFFIGLTLVVVLTTAELAVEEGDVGRAAQDNSYMSMADYIGSSRCGDCHPGDLSRWQETLHTQKVRPIDESNVLADFSLQPDIGEDITIYHEAGTADYFVELAGNNYTVDWVLGSGTWKQRFMVDLENSTFILPLQWNTADGEWVDYHPEHWFDADGSPSAHDWKFGADPVKQVALENSWQKNCAGCHTTGYTPTQNDNAEWVNNFTELNIGCEACHGPGSLHADSSGDEAYIWRSANSNVCSQCHVRGTSLDGEHGYPLGMYPGDDIEDHFILATDAFWPDDMTSKKHHQQFMDWTSSGHARTPSAGVKRVAPCVNCHTPEGAQALFSGTALTDVPQGATWQITCAACHNSHGTEHEHDLRADMEELCITCHNTAGSEPPNLPHHAMYEILTGQGGIGVIGDLRMGGAVTCTDCHMPQVAKSATEWDISSHTFITLEPMLSIEHGMPNSCTTDCHNGVGSGSLLSHDSADRVVRAWHFEITKMLTNVEHELNLTSDAIDTARVVEGGSARVLEAEALHEVAEYNFELVAHEGSRGVHNFEYARALLFDSQQKFAQITTLLAGDPMPDKAPVANAGKTIVAEPGESITFTGGGSYDPEATSLTYAWDFDDTSSGSGATPSHAYSEQGAFEVTLAVTDEAGLTGNDTVWVYVLEVSGQSTDLTTILATIETLGLNVTDLEELTAALDDKAVKNQEQADQNADDLSGKLGLASLVVVLLIFLICIGLMAFHFTQEIDGLKARTRQRTGGNSDTARADSTDDEGPADK